MAYRSVAFDGLSGAGKSTLVQMAAEVMPGCIVVRENHLDPYRETTSRLNRALKEMEYIEAAEYVAGESPDHRAVLQQAAEYAQGFPGAERQAMLAYMFTIGRSVVDRHAREKLEEGPVVFDRWQVTGWAYQVDPEGYSWQDICDLNVTDYGILMPEVQFILTCPEGQGQVRRDYRDKKTIGTAGQMSKGREHIIRPAFMEIIEDLKEFGHPVYLFENSGEASIDLATQIRQAIPTFEQVARKLKENDFELQETGTNESFWLEPERLERIRQRQTS